MATLNSSGQGKHASIEDDFMYGSNVAQSHVYIRMGFLRKVYGILAAQLVLTTLTGALFISVDSVKGFVRENNWMVLVAIISTFVLLFALMWKRQETPANYILLGLFTLAEAYSVGVIVTFYDVRVVLEAFGLTCAVVIALTVYTLQSKKDFSSWGAGLFSVLWILILAGFLQFFFQSPMLERMMSIGGAVLFSLFIVFDTHMLMHKLSPEEYILASINLYLDILNLFLYILRILQDGRK
ncbi:protein lifeguard 4 isoform X6 [Lingula anatina]|uniref:Protein lifeguard 4 isoform X1 n=1 Tax=Lingula anatina TaxID=7574 RepID=A0A1S3K6N6_LINAN|nr:protein lifeguard 4 isoform X1 [Lingula anatina]XP_013418296.1 protein lifeguard 4 isoform X2 [Lingula anatina]XP_013418297.1 protein lifeguard 4 isoform X3 [Lingula anatina]XP_013418298.1 protein lifeguard 4 isoform X4 [Lingula anatina]XP_013418299.1 protein lifeguard 4 isoform X5 [Lingula anatina]XP_013418300.1 protein lifeguard 4 isoform X6 [Lingula anatina]|eukprot:XP_013418294.1 protein lifeguard 4 isoform X1 [Lingula anatina]